MTLSQQRLEKLLGRGGPLRSRELVHAGLTRSELSRMVASGRLVRLGRGLYAAPEYEPGENQALVAVAQRAPKVVFCLLTALRFHELTTQAPFQVWIAIGNKAHPPRLDYPPIRTVRYSVESLAAGVEERKVEGTIIRVTSIAKTVADCFKFRNKVGLDIALEALRDARRDKKVLPDEIWRYASVNRVANVMRPYLEAVA
jgi:predicted transcriptional regulator of viral defense system